MSPNASIMKFLSICTQYNLKPFILHSDFYYGFCIKNLVNDKETIKKLFHNSNMYDIQHHTIQGVLLTHNIYPVSDNDMNIILHQMNLQDIQTISI